MLVLLAVLMACSVGWGGVSLQSQSDANACPTPAGVPPDVTPIEWASQVKARHEQALLQIPGVVGAGVGRAADTGEIVIQIYVLDLTDQLRGALPACLENVRVQPIQTGEFTPR